MEVARARIYNNVGMGKNNLDGVPPRLGLLVTVKTFNYDDINMHCFIIDVINNSIVCGNVTKIGNVRPSFKRFWMPDACTRMLTDINDYSLCFLEDCRQRMRQVLPWYCMSYSFHPSFLYGWS